MPAREWTRPVDGELTPAERRALNLLLESPAEMAAIPAHEVAARLGVHETTVTRLARRLGFPGYRQLREELARPQSTSSAGRAHSRPGDAYTLARLADDEITSLQRLARLVDQEDVDALAARILAARRVHLFGPPYAQAVLAVLDRRLRRLGLDVVVLPLSGRLMAEHLVPLGADDLVLSFVFRHVDPRLNRINRYARSVGAGVAAIADESGLSFDPEPDHLVVAPRGPSPDQRSLVVPLFMAYALQQAVYHQAPESADESLLLLDDLARLVGDDEPSHWT
jgi:DNA-binding MurR/RpiR family transcriptional regulator